jgi:hypothetical protein
MGFWTLSIVRYSKNTREHNGSETGSVFFLRLGGRHQNHWRLALANGSNRVDVSSLHLKMETDPISETLCSLVFLEYRAMDTVQKPSNSGLVLVTCSH